MAQNLSNPENIVHYAGGNASLECTVLGVPSPTITWFKDGQALDGLEMDRVSVTNTINGSRVVSELQFKSLLLSDDGQYHCEANNTAVNGSTIRVTSQIASLSVQRE